MTLVQVWRGDAAVCGVNAAVSSSDGSCSVTEALFIVIYRARTVIATTHIAVDPPHAPSGRSFFDLRDDLQKQLMSDN
jgi:hypothetical protein